MAKMKSRSKRMLMDIAKVGGGSIQTASMIRDPVGSVLDMSASILEKWGSGPRRLGAVSGKIQYLNPKTGRWIKKDIKTGKVVGRKKTHGPYKGVRKSKRPYKGVRKSKRKRG